jgi:hypothetical protein
MKLLAPAGTTGISIAGETIELGQDGSCEVSPSAARELCDSHGFTVFGEKKEEVVKPPPDKFDDMSRAEVIGYIKSKGLPVVPSTDTETLKAQARTQYSPAERLADAAAIADKSKG